VYAQAVYCQWGFDLGENGNPIAVSAAAAGTTIGGALFCQIPRIFDLSN
jgi:hypothetical protein